MGGNEFGQPDNKAILKTLQLNDDLLRGVAKAMNASYAVNGIVQYNTMMDNGKTEKALKELEAHLKNSESGFLPLDIKASFTPLEHKSEIVDDATLKFIDEKILRNWGVPLCILTGDYSKEQYAALKLVFLLIDIRHEPSANDKNMYEWIEYNGFEPIIIAMSQALTKGIFTTRQLSFGNKINLYPKELIFMTMAQTLEMINILSPTGALFENEKRVALGLRPMPDLEGKRYMSLNWINADDASQYQVGKNVKVDVVDENKTVTEE